MNQVFLPLMFLLAVANAGNLPAPEGAVTAEHPPFEIVAVNGLNVDREVNSLIQDVVLRERAGEDVDRDELRQRIEAMVEVVKSDIRYYAEENRLFVPVLDAIQQVRRAQGNEERLSIAYRNLGQSFWTALNSAKAIPLMKALLALVQAGLLPGDNLGYVGF